MFRPRIALLVPVVLMAAASTMAVSSMDSTGGCSSYGQGSHSTILVADTTSLASGATPDPSCAHVIAIHVTWSFIQGSGGVHVEYSIGSHNEDPDADIVGSPRKNDAGSGAVKGSPFPVVSGDLVDVTVKGRQGAKGVATCTVAEYKGDKPIPGKSLTVTNHDAAGTFVSGHAQCQYEVS